MTNAEGHSALVGEGLGLSFLTQRTKCKVAALHDVSFTIATGSLTAWVGPDGAGKTTLLRVNWLHENVMPGRRSVRAVCIPTRTFIASPTFDGRSCKWERKRDRRTRHTGSSESTQ